MRADLGELYRELRPYAFAIAYRMLGSVAEAEDVVQEAFIRVDRADADALASPKAYIATVTTRLAIDALRSARISRQSYYGPWLPEPLLDAQSAGDVAETAETAETADSLTMAFLVLLEQLTPVERAVFLLHDVFDYGYDEIAAIVGKSEPNCRQLASRARRHLDGNKPRFEASRQERDRLAEQFFAACQGRDMSGLVELLAADAVLYGDGGEKGTGIKRPVYGRDDLVKLLLAWFRLIAKLGLRFEPGQVNGQPGGRFLDPDGRLVNVMTLDIADGRIQTVRSIINPEKLVHLGPLSAIGRRKPGEDAEW